MSMDTPPSNRNRIMLVVFGALPLFVIVYMGRTAAALALMCYLTWYLIWALTRPTQPTYARWRYSMAALGIAVSSNYLFFTLLVHHPASDGRSPYAGQRDDANAEIRLLVNQIKEDGPPELRRLPASAIESTATTFVYGRQSGLISEAQMARMGGIRKATEDALLASLKLNGSR